jgi:hypothetical protein
MLPYATPAIAAQLDIWEERERDTLRTGKGVEVGDLVAGDGHQLKLPAGWHRLRIYADQPGNATPLRIVFDPTPERPPAGATGQPVTGLAGT